MCICDKHLLHGLVVRIVGNLQVGQFGIKRLGLLNVVDCVIIDDGIGSDMVPSVSSPWWYQR